MQVAHSSTPSKNVQRGAGISYRDKFFGQYFKNGHRGFAKLWNTQKQFGGDSHIQAHNNYGAKLNLNPFSYIDAHILREGYYESEVLEAILTLLTGEAVLWDIGANIGLHSVTAKYLRPHARVVAIEPAPLMVAQIERNARLNEVEIEMVSIALSNTRGFTKLHIASEGNPGMSTLKPWSEAHYRHQILCWCDTGEYLVENNLLPQPSVIKIDVEGSELEVVQGLGAALASPVLKAIVFEDSASPSAHQVSELRQTLINAGFEIAPLTRHEQTHHNLENYIARRP